MNVDPLELEKFSQLAHRWWDRESEFKPLHDINPLRLDYIDRIAPLSGKAVLDVGCGGGILTEAMAGRGAQVTGIDLADKPLKVAQLHLLESGLKVEYIKIVRRRARAQSAAALRRGDMHGAPGTRAGSGCNSTRLQRAPETRWLHFFRDDQQKSEVVPFRRYWCGIRAEAPAARHTRLPEIHQAIGAGRDVPPGDTLDRRPDGNDLQPVYSDVCAWTRHDGQLHHALSERLSRSAFKVAVVRL